jgi:hypothetical protein
MLLYVLLIFFFTIYIALLRLDEVNKIFLIMKIGVRITIIVLSIVLHDGVFHIYHSSNYCCAAQFF